jgi:hypothetical protein
MIWSETQCASWLALRRSTPYTSVRHSYDDHPLLHSSSFLVKWVDVRPPLRDDLVEVFSEDYGQTEKPA